MLIKKIFEDLQNVWDLFGDFQHSWLNPLHSNILYTVLYKSPKDKEIVFNNQELL